MSELNANEPSFEAVFYGEIHELKRNNAKLFTYFGELATRDHILIYKHQEEDGSHLLIAGFKDFTENFEDYEKKMRQEKYESHDNLQAVSPHVEATYQNFLPDWERANEQAEKEVTNFDPDSFNWDEKEQDNEEK